MTRSETVSVLALAAGVAFTTPVLGNDFHGAYVGVGLSAGFNAPVVPDWEGSAFIGYNWEFANRLVAGSELDLTVNPHSLWGATAATTSTLDARFGYLAREDVMVYGRTGGGYTSGGPGSYVWDLGIGAEYMMQNGLTVRGEFDRVDPFEAGMDTQLNGRLGVVMNF